MIKCDFSLWMPNWLIVFPHRCHDFSTFLPPLGVAAALLSSPAAGFGPIGPQHSLKCQMVSLTRENFSVWKKAIDRAERNLERERERDSEKHKELRGRKLRGRESWTWRRVRDLIKECRKEDQTYGQSTRHESEVRVRYSREAGMPSVQTCDRLKMSSLWTPMMRFLFSF